MGFKREAKLYRLKFEDPELNGFQCLMRSLSIREFRDLATLGDTLQSRGDGTEKAFTALFGLVASKLQEWNLEDEDGQPVPSTLEGIEGQELDFVMQVVTAWMTAIAGVAPPLPESLNSGETSPAVQLHLAEASSSLAS